MSLYVLSDREMVSNNYAQRLKAAAARDSWLWWWFIDMLSPPPTVGKKNFARLVTVKIEIILLGPVLNIGELDVTRGFIGGWYNQIGIIGKFT